MISITSVVLLIYLIIWLVRNLLKKKDNSFRFGEQKIEYQIKEASTNSLFKYTHDDVIKGVVKVVETLDHPKSFGGKIFWITIKSDNPNEIAEALSLTDTKKANWETGLDIAYNSNESLFVSPSVDGWVFIIGNAIGGVINRVNSNTNDINEKTFANFLDLFGKNLKTFFYFASIRTANYYAWVSVKDLVIQRAFEFYDGDIYEEGEISSEELKLNIELRNISKTDDEYFASEEYVLDLAAAWSINILDFDDTKKALGTGILGRFNLSRISS